MIEFKTTTGHLLGKTMTVSELIAKLSEYPADMPVFGEWEGVSGYINEASFSLSRVYKGGNSVIALGIDVEDY